MILGLAAAGLAIAVIMFFAVSALLQLLWNMTLPDLFGTKTINYWQAFRLLLIAGILFSPGAFVRFNAGGNGNSPITTFGPPQ